MALKPVGERILIEPRKAEERTAGGLYLPESAKEKHHEGKVISIGDSDKIKVKPGDYVIYESYGGAEVEVDGTQYVIMEYKDVLAVKE